MDLAAFGAKRAHTFCFVDLLLWVFLLGIFFQRKRGKERREKDTFRVSILAPEAYRYRQRSSLRRIIRKARNTRFEREREREIERGRKRDPTPIASTRAFERVDLVVGAAVSRREREREREIGFLLPSSFLN